MFWNIGHSELISKIKAVGRERADFFKKMRKAHAN